MTTDLRAYSPNAPIVGKSRLKDFDAMHSGSIFTGWIGKNPMSPERAAALQSIFQKSGRPVVFITDDTRGDWEVPESPFHPAYPYLSEVHKADYLRVYVLHHFGGGYTDIKPVLKSWTPHFEMFSESDALALGYPELSPNSVAQLPGELGQQLRTHYAELIGVCSLIFRRQTALTTEWISNTHRHLTDHFETLKQHPARHPMDRLGVTLPDGSVSKYPFEWTGVGGNQFHPAILKFRHQVMQTADITPQLHAYR